ncbi:nucleotidyltransferase domain-containing protein [Vulcanisaeta sp. JCM 14467]|uniref:nucleotidyltransferase domain-containing protein n=1 Tax=Vulcanisaeta sp. JCM 14467 TaxID=1295370 RepID=UPI0006CF24D8|nr:nucleotidyltransferase domain-containing protein [Vulcanisaeta sp. JCM 14467]
MLDIKRVRDRILNNIDYYLDRIKYAVLKLDPNAELMLIGSYVRGDFRADSDVNVLVISDVYGDDPHKYVELVMRIIEEVGEEVLMLFEFHVVTRRTYEDWYGRFIDVYRLI